jgi:hypothetical protein
MIYDLCLKLTVYVILVSHCGEYEDDTAFWELHSLEEVDRRFRCAVSIIKATIREYTRTLQYL